MKQSDSTNSLTELNKDDPTCFVCLEIHTQDLPLVDELTPSPSASSSASATPTIVDKFKTRTADENPCGALK